MTIDFSNEKLERIANDILLLDKLARKEKHIVREMIYSKR